MGGGRGGEDDKDDDVVVEFESGRFGEDGTILVCGCDSVGVEGGPGGGVESGPEGGGCVSAVEGVFVGCFTEGPSISVLLGRGLLLPNLSWKSLSSLSLVDLSFDKILLSTLLCVALRIFMWCWRVVGLASLLLKCISTLFCCRSNCDCCMTSS